MGTVSDKAQYTYQAVDDIRSALVERGAVGADTDELATLGDKIRLLKDRIQIYSKELDISEGTWNGVTLSESSYVNICTEDAISSWNYYHNLNIDQTKVKFVAGYVEACDGYWIRVTRGYESGSSTKQYQYIPRVSACYIGGHAASIILDNYNQKEANTSQGSMAIGVSKNQIQFTFRNEGRSPFAVRGKNLKFGIIFGYEE